MARWIVWTEEEKRTAKLRKAYGKLPKSAKRALKYEWTAQKDKTRRRQARKH